MNTYHAKSYSKQARELADRFLEWNDLYAAAAGLFNTYRHPLIRQRAIGRFSRKLRQRGLNPVEYLPIIDYYDYDGKPIYKKAK